MFLTELPTLNFTVVPGCCVAEKPELPKRDVVPPNGFEVVLVDPKSPPLLVLVPKSENEATSFETIYNTIMFQHTIMKLTSKGSGFVCTESIVRLWEETACGASPRVAKQASWCATHCPKTKASAGGGSGWLAECAGPKKSTFETETTTSPSLI